MSNVNIAARSAVAYTGAEGVTSEMILGSITRAIEDRFGVNMLFSSPVDLSDRLAQDGDKLGEQVKLYKVTVEEVGTTE